MAIIGNIPYFQTNPYHGILVASGNVDQFQTYKLMKLWNTCFTVPGAQNRLPWCTAWWPTWKDWLESHPLALGRPDQIPCFNGSMHSIISPLKHVYSSETPLCRRKKYHTQCHLLSSSWKNPAAWGMEVSKYANISNVSKISNTLYWLYWKMDEKQMSFMYVYVIVIQATGSSCSAASTVSATWTSRGLRCHTWRRRHWSPSFPAPGNHGNHGNHGNREIFPWLSAPLGWRLLNASELATLSREILVTSGDHLTECDL